MSSRAAVGRLVLVPALITLAVTALRLAGELLRWDPRLFSREAGGAGAIVGIVWLVPVFGIYFARKLVAAGDGPAGGARALGYAVLGLALVPIAMVVGRALKLSLTPMILTLGVVSVAAAFIASRGWPSLGRVLACYGLAARVPVAILMLVAMMGNWGTHYELGPPNLPPMGLFTKWVVIGLIPQLTFWIAFTVIVGIVFGLVAAMLAGRSRSAAGVPAPTGRA